MDLQRIGSFLAQLRKERGLTQEQLAQELGTSNKTISRWETGVYLPPVEMLQLLSDMYGLTINELIAGQRIAPENQLTVANENIATVIRESPFLFKERQAYWQRKWVRDHRLDLILIAVLALSVQLLAILLGKPAWATAGAFLTMGAAILLNNRKAGYVEHHLYDENLPQD
ncbi:MAG: helix-turn-helix transcriptional regulator [Clostridiales bacterium]|nr:helix-turn-helix transcriptional regulator [Clostridiales bacterium]